MGQSKDSSGSVNSKIKDTLFLYFPLKDSTQDSTERSNSLDPFRNVWYSKKLAAMKEPNLSEYESDNETYRFTWLRSFNEPIMIRIQKVNSNFTVTVKQLSGRGGYQSGHIIMNKTFKIKKSEWNELQTKLKQINFSQLKSENEWRGFDGAEWILEGVTKYDYHYTIRWFPGKTSSYAKCCLYFLKLSRIKIVDDEIY